MTLKVIVKAGSEPGAYLVAYDTGYSYRQYPVNKDTTLAAFYDMRAPGVGRYLALLSLAVVQAVEQKPIQRSMRFDIDKGVF